MSERDFAPPAPADEPALDELAVEERPEDAAGVAAPESSGELEEELVATADTADPEAAPERAESSADTGLLAETAEQATAAEAIEAEAAASESTARLQELEAVVEALLFAATEPVPRPKLLEVFDTADREAAAAAVERVIARYGPEPHRGIVLEEVGGGLRLVTRAELHPYLRRFFEASGANKLSMAALETLAIVAYRQPITAPEIQELRSVSPSGVLKTLLERRMIRMAGRKQVVGKPFLYTTTREFLMHFGLESLKDLPPLEELEESLGMEAGTLPALPEVDREESILREAAAIDEQRAEAEPDETPEP